MQDIRGPTVGSNAVPSKGTPTERILAVPRPGSASTASASTTGGNLASSALGSSLRIGRSQGRREFIRRVTGVVIALVTLALFGCGQVPSQTDVAPRIRRIGYLDPGSPGSRPGELEAFRDQLRELGYVEGETIAIEYRYAEGAAGRLSELAEELAALELEAIVAFGTQSIEATQEATEGSATPIIMASSSDPVGSKFVASLAQPGGRITGLTSSAPQLTGKRLQLLKAAFPSISRVAYFWDSRSRGDLEERVQIELAAEKLGLQLISLDVQGSRETFAGLFSQAVNENAEALITFASGLINNYPEPIVSFASERSLPAMYAQREFVTEHRGVMAYGPNYPDMYRRAAIFVDKVLNGAKPSQLPVEKPRRFKLVIGQESARALGFTVPRSVLVQVDEVV